MPNDDPNTFSGESALCFAAGKVFGSLPGGEALVNSVCSRSEALKTYQEVRPLLLQELESEAPNQQLVLFLAGKLTETADFGAYRANFRNHYIDGNRSGSLTDVDINRVRKLPADPRDIMFGFWGSYW